MLGVDDLQEYKLTVPANSLVLCHQDLFHRGTRALVETAPWRPMFGIRNLVRVSDPVAPTWAEDDADQPTVGAFAHTGAPRALALCRRAGGCSGGAGRSDGSRDQPYF